MVILCVAVWTRHEQLFCKQTMSAPQGDYEVGKAGFASATESPSLSLSALLSLLKLPIPVPLACKALSSTFTALLCIQHAAMHREVTKSCK